MAPTPALSDSSFQDLLRRVDDLSARVQALEGKQPTAAVSAATAPVSPPLVAIADPSTLPLLGKALLGLALAYLLRALVEMQIIPVSIGVPVGIAYAIGWLASASRAADASAVKIRAVTATLVVLPLLRETQMRFKAFSTWVTAAVLVLFSVFGLAISWRKNLAAVAWVATLTGALTIFSLMIATRDLTPFVWALLALAVAVELSACLDHWLAERWLIAATVDCAIALATWLVTQPRGLPAGYVPVRLDAIVAAHIVLLLVYLASEIVRTFGRRLRILSFEVVQCVAAFAIAGAGTLSIAHGQPTVVAVIAGFCVLCGIVCYTAALLFHARADGENRNATVYATFGLALFASAAFLLASGAKLSLVFTVLAVAASLLGGRFSRVGWHAFVYLLLAGFVLGLFSTAEAQFLHHSIHVRPPGLSLLALSIAAAFCAWRSLAWDRQHVGLRAALVSLASVYAAIAAGAALEWLTFDYLPMALTAVLVLIAAALAWLSGRTVTRELAWIGYSFLAFETIKLVVQDLPAPKTLGRVGSLLLYGVALMVIPRLRARA